MWRVGRGGVGKGPSSLLVVVVVVVVEGGVEMRRERGTEVVGVWGPWGAYSLLLLLLLLAPMVEVGVVVVMEA